jgi:hypothetical protein
MSAPLTVDENAERIMRLVAAAAWDRTGEVQDTLNEFVAEGEASMLALCFALASGIGAVGEPFGEEAGDAGFSVIDIASGEVVNPDAETGDSAAYVRAMRFLTAYTNGDDQMCSTLFGTADDGGTWIAALLLMTAAYTRSYLMESAAGLPHVPCDDCRLGPIGGEWQPMTFAEGPFGRAYSTHHSDCARFGTDLDGGS